MSDEQGRAAGPAPASTTSFAPTPGYANYVLIVLFVAYVFNFIDRQILAILLQPIKEELQVSDTAMGFLTGIAFAIFYTFAGIPIARWADRGNRVFIMTAGLTIWSGMTALSGVVRSFLQLALARIGVGIGEAAFVPPAHSLISDYFPPQRRATALAVFSMGIYVGVAFGFLLGGWIAQYFGWRRAFFAVGLPGLVIALIMRLTLREPPRGHSEGIQDRAESQSIGDVFRFMWGLRAFRHLALGAALHSFGGYAFANWGPAFYIRVHGMSLGQLGTWLGLILGIGGAFGTILGGRLADALGSRDVRWNAYLPALATIASIPCILAILFLPTYQLSMFALIPNSILGAMWFGPVFAMTQGLAKLRMRALASAVLVFIINIIGLGLGPQAVGFLNDRLMGQYGAEAVRFSLLILIVVSVWAAAHFWLASRTLAADLKAKDA